MSFQPRSADDIAASLSVALQPSNHGRHLVRHLAPTEPFFFLGDTAWELLHRLSDEEAGTYLRNRARKGFNAAMVVIFAEHGGLDFPNREGHFPFHPLPPTSTATSDTYRPDLTRPNPSYFAFLDRLLPLAASLGITIPLVPTWGRYINGGYYGSPILFDTDSAYSFGHFLGKRYPFQPWILGGDSNRYWNPGTAAALRKGQNVKELEVIDYAPVYEAMARGLIDGEKEAIGSLDERLKGDAKGYKTFITFHSAQVWLPKTPATTSSAQFPSADWLSLDVVQTGHHDGPSPPDTAGATQGRDVPEGTAQGGAVTQGIGLWRARSSYIPIRQMYDARAPNGRPRPVMDLEPHYENTHEWFQNNRPMWRGRDIRLGGWQAIFAGACGYTYGVNSIWQFHNSRSTAHPPIAPPTTASTDWYLELDLQGAHYASLMRTTILSLPHPETRIPDNSFILDDRFEPADGTPAGEKLIQGMRGRGWAMVHLPQGTAVRLDSQRMFAPLPLEDGKTVSGIEVGARHEDYRGTIRSWWIDPRTGARDFHGDAQIGGVQHFKRPGAQSEGEDWLLYCEAL